MEEGGGGEEWRGQKGGVQKCEMLGEEKGEGKSAIMDWGTEFKDIQRDRKSKVMKTR